MSCLRMQVKRKRPSNITITLTDGKTVTLTPNGTNVLQDKVEEKEAAIEIEPLFEEYVDFERH